jgi:hypothetical protein
MRPFRLLLVAVVATCCGCSYLKNRANDALDVFRLQASWGPGLYASARATDFCATGLGMRLQETVGMYGRYGFTDFPWPEAQALGFGVAVLEDSIPYQLEPLLDDTSQLDDGERPVGMQVLFFLPSMGMKCEAGYSVADRGLRVADVNASLALVYVGADVGLSPGELIDLLLGFAGIDVADDDAFGRGDTKQDESPATPP